MSDFWNQFNEYINKFENDTSIVENPEHLLAKILIHAEEERQTLEAQFNPISITKQENLSIVSQLKTGISKANELLQQHEKLRNEELKLADQMTSHRDDVESIPQAFRTRVKLLNDTTRILDYFRCLETFLKYNSLLEKSLSNNQLDESLNIYLQLAQLTEHIQDTSTEHLRAYSANLTIYWYEQIKNVLNKRMENILDLLEFPYVNKKPSSYLVELFEINREKFREELKYLIQLRLPNHIKHQDSQSRIRFIGWKPIPLFIQILLKSLIIRFNFHFYGKTKTNDRKKPEWYLNQVLSWILDHEYFLTKQLQPLLDEITNSSINAKVEFIRGLLELIIAKLDSQMTSIIVDRSLFTHYIEEILIFSQRLFDPDINYPRSLPNCMNLLCDEIVFEKWFQVENDVAQIKLQNIFQSSTAYQSVYERMLERNNDEIKISECAETFLTLIHAMEERYRLVPYPSCSLRLLSLQIDLLDNFLKKLKFTLLNDQFDNDPLSRQFCSILNSIVYVADVIQQWKTRPHYQRLQYFFNEYKIFDENSQMNDPKKNPIQIDSILAPQFDLIQLNKTNSLVDVTIFDNLLQDYRDEEEENCNTIVNYILKSLRLKSRKYIEKKWSDIPSSKEYFSMNISSSAIDALLELQSTFLILSINLLKNVCNEIRARIILEFDEFLFNCIITDHTFNEGGAAQFFFDINRGWSRVTNDYVSQLFNKCRESATLLTMSIGSALLLRDALKQELPNLTSSESIQTSPMPSPLHEMGIHHLSSFEAEQVLQHRLDLSNC